MDKISCIIAAGVWGGKRSLLKNRDRNYKPKVRLIHTLLGGVEVLFMRDEITGWCEGLNEYGIGVVNSALAVVTDEDEKTLVKTKGKKSKDGDRILSALGCKTLDEAVKKVQSFLGGLRGHTFVSSRDKLVTLEATPKHECKTTELDATGYHVRTNHGITYPDAGYTVGPKRDSSLSRFEQAQRVLPGSTSPFDLTTLLMNHRGDTQDPNNMVRDTEEMSTTSQLVLDLTDLILAFYVLPEKCEYLGYVNDLPADYTPKIKHKVFYYSDLTKSLEKSMSDSSSRKADAKSTAIMKFLSGVARSQGVGDHIYVVGGAVRNHLLGVPVKDVDVVADSVAMGQGRDAEWFAKKVADAIPVPSNLVTNQYGVAILTVKGSWVLEGIDLQGEVIEIANARKESYDGAGGKGKGYKPTDVSPATIQEDVFRREFNFNTLLWRLSDLVNGPEKAEILDLTGRGKKDLAEGIINTPRDPDIVFKDDPTRMLRALKFLLRYDLKIPSDVAASIRRNAPRLADMPWEAVATILLKDILNSPKARRALVVMSDLGLNAVLADMIQKTPPFAAFLTRQLTTGNHAVDLLLDLTDLGIDKKVLGFLTDAQKERFRSLTLNLTPQESRSFLETLKSPPLDSMALITEFSLEGRDRGALVPLAREALLADPGLFRHPGDITDAVRTSLSRVAGTAGTRTAHLVEDQRTGSEKWFLWDLGGGRLLVSQDLPKVGDPRDLLAFGDPQRKKLDFDPDVDRVQTRFPGLTNLNRNNRSRDSYTIPYGSSKLTGSPRLVRNILLALVKSGVLTGDWKIVNSPEYRGQTIDSVLREKRPDPVDEIAGKTVGAVTFYHGTSALRWGIIQRQGLKPGQPHGLDPGAYIDLVKNYSEHNVYLSTSIPEAEKYATRAAIIDHSPAVVLSVVVKDLTRFLVDEDAAEALPLPGLAPGEVGQMQFSGHWWKILPDGKVDQGDWRHGPYAKEIERQFQAQTLMGLRKNKTVAYRGRLPASDIKVVETYKPVRMKNDPKYDHEGITQEEFQRGMQKVRETMKYPKQSDLQPPLGGGPCRIVDRILSKVKNPRLRDELVEEVQGGHSLPNEDARKIYPFDKEIGSFFKSFSITPHAQYRMDLRGISVKQIGFALDSFAAHILDLKKRGSSAYEAILAQDPIVWLDPRMRLEIAFGLGRDSGDITIITAYWKGRRDPPPTECSPSRVARLFLEVRDG